jgi:hypothetical protein
VRVALAALGELGIKTLSELHGGIMLPVRKGSRWPGAKAGQTPRNQGAEVGNRRSEVGMAREWTRIFANRRSWQARG